MTFRHSTLDPISGIARAVTFKKKEDVVEALNLWRAAKDEELQFVKIAVRLLRCCQVCHRLLIPIRAQFPRVRSLVSSPGPILEKGFGLQQDYGIAVLCYRYWLAYRALSKAGF